VKFSKDPETCENCKYFVDDTKVTGLCRRHPPVRVETTPVDGAWKTEAKFPAVPRSSWCGEWMKGK